MLPVVVSDNAPTWCHNTEKWLGFPGELSWVCVPGSAATLPFVTLSLRRHPQETLQEGSCTNPHTQGGTFPKQRIMTVPIFRRQRTRGIAEGLGVVPFTWCCRMWCQPGLCCLAEVLSLIHHVCCTVGWDWGTYTPQWGVCPLPSQRGWLLVVCKVAKIKDRSCRDLTALLSLMQLQLRVSSTAVCWHCCASLSKGRAGGEGAGESVRFILSVSK